MKIVSRRNFVYFIASAPILAACSRSAHTLSPDFISIEKRTKGRIGIAAIDLSSGRTISHRGNESFAMCSTFKWLLGALILQKKTDQGNEDLARRIEFTKDDLVSYSPVAKSFAGKGGMSICYCS